jgi:hypothetical protein
MNDLRLSISSERPFDYATAEKWTVLLRGLLKLSFLVAGATITAAIATRLSDHDLALGFPFTWYTRQDIVTLGEQPHSFSLLLMLLDFVIALLALATFVRLVRGKLRHPSLVLDFLIVVAGVGLLGWISSIR